MTTYTVGVGKTFARLSDLTERLLPGDLVELYTPIVDCVVLDRPGQPGNPITIRGIGEHPVAVDAAGGRETFRLLGDHYRLENLEITGGAFRGVNHRNHDLTVLGCYIHHNGNGIMGADHVCTGDIHINRCEFFANGAGLYAHQMYLCSYRPGAQAIVEHCYIHDATGGANLKTRMPRNLIRYNWLENAASYAVDMVDADKCNGITEGGDFYGNVVLAAENYTTKQLVHLGSDQDCSPGNRGRFRLTHNLFVTVSTMTRVINVHGIVGEVALYNNIFLGRRERFAAAVGAGGWPLDTQIGRIVARNNWIHPGALECYIDNDVPPVALDFTGTLPDRADEPIDRPGATT
ncbi:MAG TPA: hypothetical protein VL860_11145, partial [Planctomycetota bacterium]|nr:hypothetical protein [Planctomycetota bacterium]